MDVPDVMQAMATVIAAVPGIKSAYYPAVNSINDASCPAVVLYWGGDDETRIEHGSVAGGTMWLPSVMAQVLIPRKGNTPSEFAKVDALVTPIVDAFARNINEIPALAGKVHRCHVTRVRTSMQVTYAGSEYYAAELIFDIKMHRRKGS